MKYKDLIDKILSEQMVAGGADSAFGQPAAGDVGSFGGAFGNTDFYAPGDARRPTYIGAKTKKKRKKKKKTKSNEEVQIPIQRRAFPPNIWKESLKIEPFDESTPLSCTITIKNPQFEGITKRILEKNDIEFDENNINNIKFLSFSKTDDEITKFTDQLVKIMGEKALNSGDNIIVLIAEARNASWVEDDSYKGYWLLNGKFINVGFGNHTNYVKENPSVFKLTERDMINVSHLKGFDKEDAIKTMAIIKSNGIRIDITGKEAVIMGRKETIKRNADKIYDKLKSSRVISVIVQDEKGDYLTDNIMVSLPEFVKIFF